MVADWNDAHLARLLILVHSFCHAPEDRLDGLTKLAKLDFLLRYPRFLDHLNEASGIVDMFWQPPSRAELVAVPDPMIRYRYGPWDHRYYGMIGALVGRDLVSYERGRGRVALRPTERGAQAARALRRRPEWADVASRSDFLKHHYDVSGSRLKDLIYESFPTLVDQPLGAIIGPDPVE